MKCKRAIGLYNLNIDRRMKEKEDEWWSFALFLIVSTLFLGLDFWWRNVRARERHMCYGQTFTSHVILVSINKAWHLFVQAIWNPSVSCLLAFHFYRIPERGRFVGHSSLKLLNWFLKVFYLFLNSRGLETHQLIPLQIWKYLSCNNSYNQRMSSRNWCIS